jgi:hypothetical protein
MKNILVLGGYGSAGCYISELLIKLTQHKIIISGRDLTKATNLSDFLNKKYNTNRAVPENIDICNINFLNNIDIIILAAPVIKFLEKIIDSAEKNNCKLFDITPPTEEKYKLFPTNTKNLYVTELGGMFPLVMIRHINLKNVLRANFYNFYEIDWSDIKHCKETVPEFEKTIESNLKNKSLYIKNKWYTMKEIPCVYEKMNGETIEFKTTWSKEITLIKEIYPSIIQIGCFHKINDYPIIKEKTILKARIENEYKKIVMYVKCDSGYVLTAASVVAAIMQNSKKNIISGVYTSGEYLDTEIFFKDLKEKMGIEILVEYE